MPYEGPLIDTHAHLNPPARSRSNETADVLAAIASAGVDRIVLQPPPNEGLFRGRDATQRQRFDLQQTSGGRVLRMCGSEYLTVWMANEAARGRTPDAADTAEQVRRLKRDLESGTCAGVGEIGILHFNTRGDQPVVRLPPAYPPLLDIAVASAAAGAWMEIHAEPMEPDGTSHHANVYRTLAEMFRRAPDLRLIYAHNGLTNVRNARALLTAFPNLMMNLGYVPREGWLHLDPIMNEYGELYADWAALMEEMPERFMIGSDFLFGWIAQPTANYVKAIARDRRMLGSLAPAAARRIAFENAEKVFGPLTK